MIEQNNAPQTTGGKVISVGSVKGGVNKSTTAIHVAVAFHQLAREVLLICTDGSARTARDWYLAAVERAAENGQEYNGPTVETADDVATVLQVVPQLRAQYDVIVIDGAAMADEMLGAMFAVSDLVISPCTASKVTLKHALDTVDAATAYREQTGHPVRAAVLFSNVKPQTRIYRDRRLDAEQFAPVFTGCIANSTRIEEAMDDSATVWDNPTGAQSSIDQYNQLAIQCIHVLAGSHPICSWTSPA